jgi:glutamate carboxypeptidase
VSLREAFVNRQNEFLSSVRTLVETESPSGDVGGIRAVVSLLAEMAAQIGAVNSIDRIPADDFGEHLRIRAFSKAHDGRQILLLGHTDTVHPRGSIQARPWRVDQNQIHGPGIFDMKSNCALAIEILRVLDVSESKSLVPITLLLTCDEESGSPSGRALVEAEAKNSLAVLVMEPSASGGRAKTARKGTGMFTVEVEGRAAHAGLDPEKGVNAVLELARQTVRLSELNDPANGTNVSVTIFNGGSASNVVPA